MSKLIFEKGCNVVINFTEVLDQTLYNDLQALHRNCDPMNMTHKDHLVWEKWNKVFNPQNYC